VALRIDANQAWQEDQAIAYLAELENLNIEYIEQPLAAKNLAGMARLRQLTKVAIAADEAVQNLAQLDLVIAHQAADLVVLKPMALGGILTAKLAAEKAEAAGLGVVITTTLDGAIARLGALHLAAALPQLSYACGLATGYLLGQDFYLDQVQGGRLSLPGATGIGIEPAGVLWKQ
jgi:L-alanine-DL-glutamate epimerase-like enolase superfamily enzyme